MSGWLEARNILAVRLDNIGDVVMLGPALRAVKETSPRARITLLGTPAGVQAAELLPWIGDTITWRPVWQDIGGTLPFDPDRERALIDLLAGRGFDAALIFTSFSQTPHVPGYVCYLAGIPLRAGESKEFGGGTLTDALRGAPDDLHQVERNLRLVEQVGYTVRDRKVAIAIPDTARENVDGLLARAGLEPAAPFILLHPGASAQARRYPAPRFGEVARLLTQDGYQVLVTATERERPAIDEVRTAAPAAGYLIGESTLPEFAALVERSDVVVCGNTLPLHLADALGTPVVALFSGTDYESQWEPRFTASRILRRPTPCHPCYLFECPIGKPCLDVSPQEVVEAVTGLRRSARAAGVVLASGTGES